MKVMKWRQTKRAKLDSSQNNNHRVCVCNIHIILFQLLFFALSPLLYMLKYPLSDELFTL